MFMSNSFTRTSSIMAFICLIAGMDFLSAQKTAFQMLEPAALSVDLQDPQATPLPPRFAAFELEMKDLSDYLSSEAPDEFSGDQGALINLPMPDGTIETFEVYYSPVFEPGLQAKYPDIRSYIGKNVSKKGMTLRMTLSQIGLKAAVRTDEGTVYIDPVIEYNSREHVSYFPSEIDQERSAEFICGVKDHEEDPLDGIDLANIPGGLELRSAGEAVGIRTFRTAIAATGEWTLREGSKANAMAKIAASVDRANLIFEVEVAVRLILVDNNDLIVFEDPDTDPYPGDARKDASALINSNTFTVSRNIGEENYDLGHVFTLGCLDGVGGLARTPSICNDQSKAAGTTCWSSSSIEANVVRIFCHEVGHQFSAKHTFNHCDTDNENLPTGYEPGSGSTIMSYAGVCGGQNVQSREDPYFHCNSVSSIFNYSRNAGCGDELTTNNTRPDVTFDYEDGFTIPVSTPFFLKGTGTDMEGDDLTYCIEQHDAGTKICNRGTPEGSCPAFRSFPPVSEDYRILPRFGKIWNNLVAGDRNEVLVDYSREFNFVITARDNNDQIGGYGMDTITFNTTSDAGPFEVTFPNDGESLTANKYELITWDVANTDQAPVNCTHVDILMHRSTDFEDYIVLKTSTENDGRAWVLMPDEEVSDMRITVVASENIFFDISNQNSDVVPSADTTYSLGLLSNSAKICLPDVFETEVLASSLGGYQGNIELDIISGLPSGATVDFGQSTISADGGSSDIVIDMTNVTDNGVFDVTLQAIGENGDTTERIITLETVNSDFSALATDSPADGEVGVGQNATLSWIGAADASTYDIQLATNPSFDAGSIVQENYDLGNTSINLSNPLEKNTLYFWRLRAKNVCGEGEWTIPSAFATEAAVCNEYEARDKNVTLSTGRLTQFELNIAANADIIDLNVSRIDFFCDFLSDAVVSLESPSGTEVILANKECGNVTDMLCGFDDDATRTIRCPPTNNQVFKPRGSLADFNGENAQGDWKLNLDIAGSAVASQLGEWFLEVCVNASAEGPVLVINDTLKTKPGENNPIAVSVLRTDDSNNSAAELQYILSTTPMEGELQLNGSPLSTGMSFTQEDINSGNLSYSHVGNEDVLDSFVFTVNDGEGGFTGSHIFDIDVNEANPSSASDLTFERLFRLFPNPTGGTSYLVFDEPTGYPMDLEVRDLNGRLVLYERIAAGATNHAIDMQGEAKGIYLVKAADQQRYFTIKLTVH